MARTGNTAICGSDEKEEIQWLVGCLGCSTEVRTSWQKAQMKVRVHIKSVRPAEFRMINDCIPGTLEWWNEEFHEKYGYDKKTESDLSAFDNAHFDQSGDPYYGGMIVLTNQKYTQHWPNRCDLPKEHPSQRNSAKKS
jgi:hypothetical protein